MASIRIEWVLLGAQSDVVQEVLGAVDENIDGHRKYEIPRNYKMRRGGNRVVVRVVRADSNIYLKSARPDEADVTPSTGLQYLGGFEAHKIRQGEDATYLLIHPGEQLFVGIDPAQE